MSGTGWPVALTGHFFELRDHQGVGSHIAAPNPSGGPPPGRRLSGLIASASLLWGLPGTRPWESVATTPYHSQRIPLCQKRSLSTWLGDAAEPLTQAIHAAG